MTELPSVLAKYQQVAEDLRTRIAAGEFPTDRLPGLSELARQYRVGMNTMHAAESALANTGVLTICQGEAPYIHRENLGPGPALAVTGDVQALRDLHRGLGALLDAWDSRTDVAS